MSLRPAIIHLIGHPGVGKYTVAKALVATAADSGERMVLMDNHATGNLILSILEPVDPIPGEVWDRVGEVREVVYRTIADMSPPEWSFVFTNVLVADDPGDEAVVVRLARLAQESDRHYLPVRLTCELDAHLERVASPERGPRHKWTNVDAVHRFVRTYDVVDLGAHDSLDVDTTHHAPERAAADILAHLETLDVEPQP